MVGWLNKHQHKKLISLLDDFFVRKYVFFVKKNPNIILMTSKQINHNEFVLGPTKKKKKNRVYFSIKINYMAEWSTV